MRSGLSSRSSPGWSVSMVFRTPRDPKFGRLDAGTARTAHTALGSLTLRRTNKEEKTSNRLVSRISPRRELHRALCRIVECAL